MPSRRPAGPAPDDDLRDVADRLHSLAIHLLRTVRLADNASGLSASRLSALSVVVFAGPVTIGELAIAEQVTPPTMTRMVQGLEQDGLVRRTAHPDDGRATRISATAKGNRILMAGRARRVDLMMELIRPLSPADMKAVRQAIAALTSAVARERERERER